MENQIQESYTPGSACQSKQGDISRKPEKQSPTAVGIIAEYNPFHNGHAYQIQKARELSGADYCVVVMSGDFVQRGAPAIFDKYTRTKMALLSGADLVLEIPPVFAASSAEDFSACGVSMLDRLGVVSHLCFGSECGDIDILRSLADILYREPEEFSRLMKEYLKQGNTYPQARAMALADFFKEDNRNQFPDFDDVLSSPNNILGIEYCKAIQKRNSSLIPVTIKRQGKDYHDMELADHSDAVSGNCTALCPPFAGDTCSFAFSSASAIRKAVKETGSGISSSLKSQVPPAVWELMAETTPMFLDDFSALLSYRLLELHRHQIPFERFGDVSSELAVRIDRQLLDFASFENRIQALKTRQYTYTRISRCLLHILLHMTEEDIRFRKQHDYLSYIRVLGFRKDAAGLLKAIKKASAMPFITKTADASRILDSDSYQEFLSDLFCSHIYQSAAEQKSGILRKNEYTQSVILV